MDDEDRGIAARNDTGTAPLTRRAPLLWALVALALAALVAAAALVFLRTERGSEPPFLAEPGTLSTASPRLPAGSGEDALEIAGSGSNLPLARALVAAFRQRRSSAKLLVHESIGSTGGIRAVRDGAVGVGMISRPLTSEESRLGLMVTPHARVAVVVAANPSVPDACTSGDDLVGFYAGTRTRWSDGSRAVVLQRERGDSSLLSFGALIPGLLTENDSAFRDHRFRVLYSDRAMQDALMATEGAFGIFDLGAIEAQRLPLKVLCVDGVAPSREALLSGRYPFSKDFAFVTAGAPTAIAADLLHFVSSTEGRELTARLGYVPLPLEAGAP